MKRPLKFPLKFEKGIRLVTRKRTATEAMLAFKKVLRMERSPNAEGEMGRRE